MTLGGRCYPQRPGSWVHRKRIPGGAGGSSDGGGGDRWETWIPVAGDGDMDGDGEEVAVVAEVLGSRDGDAGFGRMVSPGRIRNEWSDHFSCDQCLPSRRMVGRKGLALDSNT